MITDEYDSLTKRRVFCSEISYLPDAELLMFVANECHGKAEKAWLTSSHTNSFV